MKRFKSIFVAVFAVLIAVGSIAPALPASALSSASLSIVPKKNYIIEAGKSIKDTITIRNLDSLQPLEISMRVVDFTFTDDGGTPKLFMAEDAPQTTWSLKPFLTVPKSVKIVPGGSKTIDMSVSIPAKQGAGSYYSAIVYSSGASSGGNVGLSASGVTLVFTSVPGIVNEDLKLQKFGAYKQAAKDSGYLFMTADEPQAIAYTLTNNGNVTENPVGSIKIKDLFGREQTITEVNPTGSLALIGQTRTYTACIKLATDQVKFDGSTSTTRTCTSPGLWPGMYTASLDLFYGQNGNTTKEILGTATFWYLPWWFVIAVIIVLLALTFFVWKVVRAIRGRLEDGRYRKQYRRK